MYREHRGYIQIRNLPYHWAGTQEDSAQALRGLLYGAAQIQACCIRFAPHQTHRGTVSCLHHAYADVWVTADHIDHEMIISITVYLLASVFTLTSHCWLRQEAPRWDTKGRDITDVPTTVTRVQTMHEEVTLTLDRHYSAEVIPSIWADAHIFQAVLLEQGQVLLTTHPHNQQVPYHDHNNQGAPSGTIWDYIRHWYNTTERYTTSSRQCQPQDGWECTIG